VHLLADGSDGRLPAHKQHNTQHTTQANKSQMTNHKGEQKLQPKTASWRAFVAGHARLWLLETTEVVAVVIAVADAGDYVHYVAQYRAARQQRHRKARTHARTHAGSGNAGTHFSLMSAAAPEPPPPAPAGPES
jgi:hypothetical protein